MEKIDFDTFNKIKERMKAKFPVLLEGYIKDCKGYLATIEINIPDGDLKGLIEATHSMKSASGLLGVVHVHKAAETLEYAGKDMLENPSGNFESLRQYFIGLQDSFSSVEADLRTELSKVS
tara:strand:+ start:2126 stop:2488 length:363 start_codon:yes stop_codon:yes gene_type:complete